MTISYNAPSVREAMYAFLAAYLQPAVDPERIIWGNQNNITLPAGSDDYVIFYTQNQYRHGTDYEEYDPEAEELTLLKNNEVVVRVDCYANSKNGTDGENARLRACLLDTVFRSSVACEFFKSYNISPLYADDPQDTTFVGDSENYLRRWTINLHLCLRHSVTVTQEGFTSIKPVYMNSVSTTESGLHVAEVDTLTKSK